MSGWPDCIVSCFDLIDVRQLITAEDSKASDLMPAAISCFVNKSINLDMPAHGYAYAWNDSGMFLSFPQNNNDYENCNARA